jgi:hypothetical protein
MGSVSAKGSGIVTATTCICGNKECQIPFGTCHCGCGEKTAIAEWDQEKFGYIAGMPRKFVNGHNRRCQVLGEKPPIRFGEIEGEPVAYITLSKGFEMAIDVDELPRFEQLNCHYRKGYAFVRIGNKSKRVHSLIFNAPEGKEPDHKNRNGLDNRKSNLRAATRSEQTANSGPKMDRQYKGVEKLPNGRFRSRLRHGDTTKNLGCHVSAEDAAIAHDLGALRVFGEFAYLNFPDKRDEYSKQLLEPWFREAASGDR